MSDSLLAVIWVPQISFDSFHAHFFSPLAVVMGSVSVTVLLLSHEQNLNHLDLDVVGDHVAVNASYFLNIYCLVHFVVVQY